MVVEGAAGVLEGDVGWVVDSCLVDEAVEGVTLVGVAGAEHNVRA